ncbi:MAG: hypothetical protein ABH879_05125 [archaeon]
MSYAGSELVLPALNKRKIAKYLFVWISQEFMVNTILVDPERVLGRNHKSSPHQTTISVAGIGVNIRYQNAEVGEILLSRYKEFITEGKAAYNMDAFLDNSIKILERSKDDLNYPIEIIKKDSITIAASTNFIGEITPKSAKLVYNDSETSGAIQNFLRVLYSYLCLQNNCVLIHGASVVRNEKGYVFFGPSGSGKTTVCELSKDDCVLNDDIVIIGQEGKEHYVYGNPFWGEMGNISPNVNQKSRIRGMFRLIQSEENRIEQVSPGMGAVLLASSVSFCGKSREKYAKILDYLNDLAKSVPIHNMRFKKDASFWGCIDELEKCSGKV